MSRPGVPHHLFDGRCALGHLFEITQGTDVAIKDVSLLRVSSSLAQKTNTS